MSFKMLEKYLKLLFKCFNGSSSQKNKNNNKNRLIPYSCEDFNLMNTEETYCDQLLSQTLF